MAGLIPEVGQGKQGCVQDEADDEDQREPSAITL